MVLIDLKRINESTLKRVIKYQSVAIAIFLVIISFMVIINYSFISFITGTALFFTFSFLSVFSLYRRNKFFISKIEIDEVKTRVDFEYTIRGIAQDLYSVDIKDLKIEVKRVWYSKYPRYKLMVRDKKELKIIQNQLDPWTPELFLKVLKTINDMQGKPTYASYIKI